MMKKRVVSFALIFVLLLACLPHASLPVEAKEPEIAYLVASSDTGIEFRVNSVGRYMNWAGVSNASQFTDENGCFCFALDGNGEVTIYKTAKGEITETIQIDKPYPLFGGAVCDSDGYLYLVWGRENETDDTAVQTIFICKYDASGKLVASAGGDGSESLAYYYPSEFYTKFPFEAGNCDVAINGNLVAVNYARKMYSGHQSNGLLIVNKDTMTVQTGIKNYNSHSFDQRITPYSKTGGFLLESHGDSYPRAFSTAMTSATRTLNEMETFHFWVEENAGSDGNMRLLNRTRARLGNVLETPRGAALVASAARSMSEAADDEPYDLFVQVFDPTGSAYDADSYVTSGVRTGMAGRDGNEATTDYGVAWLTDLKAAGKTADVVQAVSIDGGRIAVLYELNNSYGMYDSTWLMILNEDGSIYQDATQLPGVRLNTDEDPIYAEGCVQWVWNQWNAETGNRTNALMLHRLSLEPHAHDYQSVVTAPTCTEQGYTTHTCACGDSYKDNYTDALGHDLVTDAEKPATCTDPGLTAGEHCTRCYYRIWQTVVPALGHSYKDGVCTRCGKKDPDYKPVDPTEPTTAPTEPTTAPTEPTTAPTEPTEPTTPTEPLEPIKFNDVTEKAWYYEAVYYAVSNGLMNGVGGGRFAPDDPMTRSMLVTVLWRYEGEKKEGTNDFTDVPARQWYTDAVAWAATNGIVGGVGNGKFDPNGNITREQMAAILFRYADKKGFDTTKRGDLSGFPDQNKVSAYATDAIAWAVAEKIIGGSNGKLEPQGNATRAQVSTILMRFIEKFKTGDTPTPACSHDWVAATCFAPKTCAKCGETEGEKLAHSPDASGQKCTRCGYELYAGRAVLFALTQHYSKGGQCTIYFFEDNTYERITGGDGIYFIADGTFCTVFSNDDFDSAMKISKGTWSQYAGYLLNCSDDNGTSVLIIVPELI